MANLLPDEKNITKINNFVISDGRPTFSYFLLNLFPS